MIARVIACAAPVSNPLGPVLLPPSVCSASQHPRQRPQRGPEKRGVRHVSGIRQFEGRKKGMTFVDCNHLGIVLRREDGLFPFSRDLGLILSYFLSFSYNFRKNG